MGNEKEGNCKILLRTQRFSGLSDEELRAAGMNYRTAAVMDAQSVSTKSTVLYNVETKCLS